jgi:large subunit ribosomal protein L4e
MKAQLFTSEGKEKAEVQLPERFDTLVREDIVQKYLEVEKHQNRVWHSPYEEAGRRHSASGTISHRRHEWKGHYGKGISRVPRKTMHRHGTQFYWIAAEVSGTRGGRSVHAPSGERTPLKINKKEIISAFNSAFASTASKELIVKRYASLDKISHAPLVIESLPKKTKELIAALKSMFGSTFNLVLQKKNVRAGIGKSRNRRYKSTAGLLIVTGNNENASFKGVEIKHLKDVLIQDLFPLGRLTLYTQAALKDMEAKA